MFSDKHLICLTDDYVFLFGFADHQTLPFHFFVLNVIAWIYFQNGDFYQGGLKIAKVSLYPFSSSKTWDKESVVV